MKNFRARWVEPTIAELETWVRNARGTAWEQYAVTALEERWLRMRRRS